ncbi:MAG: hypothetical protein AAF988_04595 [Pseudomonadota bacterium]
MYCLRDFDIAAAYLEPNALRVPELMGLLTEVADGIREKRTMEQQVAAHIKNSNYGHGGRDRVLSNLYEWSDLSDELVQDERFEHDMLHAFLAIVAEEEGWGSFFADGNHRAECLVVQMEPLFRFWSIVHTAIVAQYNENFYSHNSYCDYIKFGRREQQIFKIGWLAANNSDQPYTSYEAKFLGLPPKVIVKDSDINEGDKNKHGEPFKDAFTFDKERARVFLRRMQPVLRRMLYTLKECTLYDHRDKKVCQAFFKTIRMDEIAAIIRGEDTDGKKPLSFGNARVNAAQLNRADYASSLSA